MISRYMAGGCVSDEEKVGVNADKIKLLSLVELLSPKVRKV
jgi:hypothetical protein